MDLCLAASEFVLFYLKHVSVYLSAVLLTRFAYGRTQIGVQERVRIRIGSVFFGRFG